MSEIGLDSLRNGEATQAQALEWQLRSTFAPGCAGAFIFSWTDEWHRAGAEVEDWAFGITARDRRPKPALKTVREAFTNIPFAKELRWPKISVIVCTFNGSRTLSECLESLLRLEYPNYEVIVVNDGSTDTTAKIANNYGFRVITTENRGLASARNTGLAAATGEIVAYIDDDAYPDPHWLRLSRQYIHEHETCWNRRTEHCASRRWAYRRVRRPLSRKSGSHSPVRQ